MLGHPGLATLEEVSFWFGGHPGGGTKSVAQFGQRRGVGGISKPVVDLSHPGLPLSRQVFEVEPAGGNIQPRRRRCRTHCREPKPLATNLCPRRSLSCFPCARPTVVRYSRD